MTVEHRRTVESTTDKQFLIGILRRVVDGANGTEMNRNIITATGDILVSDKEGSSKLFVPTAIIDHSGGIGSRGETRGHYRCDVRNKENIWFHTSDNAEPIIIPKQHVTKQAAVVLYTNVE